MCCFYCRHWIDFLKENLYYTINNKLNNEKTKFKIKQIFFCVPTNRQRSANVQMFFDVIFLFFHWFLHHFYGRSQCFFLYLFLSIFDGRSENVYHQELLCDWNNFIHTQFKKTSVVKCQWKIMIIILSFEMLSTCFPNVLFYVFKETNYFFQIPC